jgi:hypothetical protein
MQETQQFLPGYLIGAALLAQIIEEAKIVSALARVESR